MTLTNEISSTGDQSLSPLSQQSSQNGRSSPARKFFAPRQQRTSLFAMLILFLACLTSVRYQNYFVGYLMDGKVSNEDLSTISEPQPCPETKGAVIPQQSRPTRQTERYSYVTGMFGGTDYLCGAAMLAWKLRNRRSDIDLSVFVAGHLDQDVEKHHHAIAYLEQLGFQVYNVPTLINSFFTHKNNEKITFSKINMYAMTNYTKIVFVDADLFFLDANKSPDKLFEIYEGYPKPVGRKIAEKDINSGFMVTRPNMTMYWDMVTKFNTLQSPKNGDQGFLNLYYHTFHEGFEYFPEDGFPQQVTNLYQHTTSPALRDDISEDAEVYHPFGPKPWQCPRTGYCAHDQARAIKYIWPQMSDLFWEHYDQMTKAWPWMLKDDNRQYCEMEKPSAKLSYFITKEEMDKERKALQKNE
uniref:Nucleotide-diphospho-sugar transferase domain-containing protein n=1 Tax=Entomoneis paludosa TaxID=265537 RepID=A0A7S3DSJ4_9STRA|mmetsp:Transcript_32839/g.68460  ORF Transcript_32839/g.68460 Transcript_32839/m.68460 type:complete len:412 (+) Transcript_32839:134-1369(+)|eukprot:CAMPEP_0172465480 /NCGR_PEP_ID=MMETSP1065-20121228/53620_1 /TAXON_ID=265537 /ORGANISM="Amphiprora paludosa, Strain CCMP125" /LENGTH=411 /DNA_ID=CAMNT_0013222011 /DNA_START=123 /DNA_END=1358 /DNA_ORIENTATION=+